MTTLIKDLIPIPARVQRNDFVLNLAHGLEPEAVAQTLADYVVTPQLARCFEAALGFIKSAVAGGQSRNKGAYVHGSFGSGKSHFMAVLDLLLQGHPDARAIPELAPAVARHSDWMQRHNILLVPYHMIDAPSLEAGVLGGYARWVARHHPEAPAPGFYVADPLFVEHELLWWGTRRRVEVVFQNVIEIIDDSVFEARGEQWKLIIDFPFDAAGHTLSDDQARVQEYEAAGGQSLTLCWLPYFLSEPMQKNLGKLVVLEQVLKSDDSFNRYSSHLSPQDRASARTLLDNQRSQLRAQLKDVLIGAYGVAEPAPGSLAHARLLETQIMSLQPGFSPRPPQGTTMAQALGQLLGQALAFQYPDHPEFEDEVRITDLGKVFDQLRRAFHAANGRIEVDSALRPLMRRIAQPLGLGEMHERHFIFKPDWPQHMTRELAKNVADSGADITVERLRQAMDQPRPRGLPVPVQNLLIMVFAEQGQHAFTLHGGPFEQAALKEIRDDLVLVKQALAEPARWQQALTNAGALFGLTVNPLRTANNQNALQNEVCDSVAANLPSCRILVDDLERQLAALGLPPHGNRLANARLAVKVLEGLQGKEGPALVDALADIQPATSMQALAKGIASGSRVRNALADNNWELLIKVWSGDNPEGQRIKQTVAAALAAGELVTELAAALKRAQTEATRLLTTPPPVIPPAVPPPKPPVDPPKGKKVVKEGTQSGLSAGEAKRVLEEIAPLLNDGVTVDLHYRIVGDD